jgi:hypothetical protein
MELGSYFLFLQEQIKDIIIMPKPSTLRLILDYPSRPLTGCHELGHELPEVLAPQDLWRTRHRVRRRGCPRESHEPLALAVESAGLLPVVMTDESSCLTTFMLAAE